MGIALHSIDQSTHSIAVGDGTNLINLDGSGNVNVVGTLTGITNDVNIADGGNSITVDDGGVTLSIDDGGGAITVDGSVTADTELNTEDHDTGAGTDTQPFIGVAFAADGGHDLVSASTPLPVTGSFTTTPGGYADWQHKQASVTTTASQLDATPLSGRINVIVQNIGSNDVYLGNSNAVTTSNGLLLAKGSSLEIALDDTATADVWAITGSSTSTVTFSEFKP